MPEQSEFQTLLTNIGTASDLSRIRASSWLNGSDSSGFGALPAYYLGVWADTNNVIVNSVGTDQAYSVRCIKD